MVTSLRKDLPLFQKLVECGAEKPFARETTAAAPKVVKMCPYTPIKDNVYTTDLKLSLKNKIRSFENSIE